MNNKVKKILITLASTVALTGIFISTLYVIKLKESTDISLADLKERIHKIEQDQMRMWDELDVVRIAGTTVDYKRNTLFSNFGTWDGESLDITASGLSTKDFTLNHEGMFTYKDRVVVATANTTRWNRGLKEGYESYELYDLLTIEINGIGYPAIVLDVCGACHGLENEEVQRIDIFTNKNVIGLTNGKMYQSETDQRGGN